MCTSEVNRHPLQSESRTGHRFSAMTSQPATRAVLALGELGYRVKEMLGGFEYRVREGFGFEIRQGPGRRGADPHTAPGGSEECGC